MRINFFSWTPNQGRAMKRKGILQQARKNKRSWNRQQKNWHRRGNFLRGKSWF